MTYWTPSASGTFGVNVTAVKPLPAGIVVNVAVESEQRPPGGAVPDSDAAASSDGFAAVAMQKVKLCSVSPVPVIVWPYVGVESLLGRP
jgi:hypothetical protein